MSGDCGVGWGGGGVKKIKNVEGERGSVKIEGFLDYDSFKLSPKEPCVQIASSVIRSLNYEPLPAIADGGLDANWITKHGVPTVSMGCGQLNAHMVTETLNLKEYLIACHSGSMDRSIFYSTKYMFHGQVCSP